MKYSAFLEATVWWVFFLGSQVGLAQDLIPVSQLGDRGVIFQTRPIDRSRFMESAQGVGDVNGDGFDDLLVSVCDQPLPAPCEIILVYGRPDLTGRHVLDENLSGTVRFRARATLRYPSTEGASAPAGDLNSDGFADFLFS